MSVRMQFRQALPHQIKNLGQLRHKLGMDDETYRAILSQYTRPDGKEASSSKDLSEAQAEELTMLWAKTAESRGIVVNLYRSAPKGVASKASLDTLRARAIRCALHYALGDAVYDVGAGQVLAGNDLRRWCFQRWTRKQALPQNILRRLFTDWVNPRSNEYLVQGGFRQYVRDPSKCFHDRLTPPEVSYLIKRFGLIASELDMAEYGEPHNAKIRRN